MVSNTLPLRELQYQELLMEAAHQRRLPHAPAETRGAQGRTWRAMFAPRHLIARALTTLRPARHLPARAAAI